MHEVLPENSRLKRCDSTFNHRRETIPNTRLISLKKRLRQLPDSLISCHCDSFLTSFLNRKIVIFSSQETLMECLGWKSDSLAEIPLLTVHLE